MSIEMIEVEEFHLGTQIKVIGVGGGGGNAVDHMIGRSVQGVEFICANTDAQALARTAAHKTIQLGGTGLGAGSKPEKGREAAEQQGTAPDQPAPASERLAAVLHHRRPGQGEAVDARAEPPQDRWEKRQRGGEHEPDGEHDPERPSGQRQQDALGEEDPRQAAAARAERGTDRQLLLARFGADEKQVRHVAAGHQQHDADGREQDPQHLADIADHVVGERPQRVFLPA